MLPFEWIERVFGYGGLALLVFVVAAIKLHPDWGASRTASSRERDARNAASTPTSSSACSGPR